jgi:hypothetical protein
MRRASTPGGVESTCRVLQSIIQPLIILLFGFASPAAAQTSDCKKCREQQQACTKNYAAKTCKTEYDICMKGCKK